MATKRVFPLICGGLLKQSESRVNVLNKYNQEVIGEVSLASRAEIKQAFEDAHKSAPVVASLSSHHRAQILTHLHSLLTKNSKEFAELLCLEAGKPINDSEIEVARCLGTLADGIKEATSATPDGNWREFSNATNRFSLISRRFPIGVASFITPFNFPLNLVMHKIAPAIAAGCPFVLKPSDQAPLSAVRLGELLTETDLPKGSYSILPCKTEDAAEFSENERIKVISFTGSCKIGWMIKERAAKKKVVLELGGNAACIVEPDSGVDVNTIVSRLLFGAFFYAGQSCISVQRILVHEQLYDEVCEKLVAGAKNWNQKKGDPRSRDTLLGPVISENDAKRIESWVNDAVSKHSGKVLVGGKRDGAFFDATVISDVDFNADVWRKEIFGPVTTIHKYSSFKDAVALANDSDFGLQTGVFTANLNKAFYAYENLEVGGVVIGDVPSARVDVQPYGGCKDSGCGREGVRYAMEDLTELKVMVLKDLALPSRI